MPTLIFSLSLSLIPANSFVSNLKNYSFIVSTYPSWWRSRQLPCKMLNSLRNNFVNETKRRKIIKINILKVGCFMLFIEIRTFANKQTRQETNQKVIRAQRFTCSGSPRNSLSCDHDINRRWFAGIRDTFTDDPQNDVPFDTISINGARLLLVGQTVPLLLCSFQSF